MAISGALGGIAERSVSEIFGFGIGTALSNSLQPESVQLAQEAWAVNPALVTEPATLARLYILERIALDAAISEAKQSGINDERFAHIVNASKSLPGTGELLELHRRAILDGDAARTALSRLGLDDRYLEQYLELAKVLLSPADLAMARQQTFITADEHYRRSALQGVDKEDAEILYLMSGLPYGAGEALELWRRNEITEDRVRQALHEGHLKNEFVDDYLKLRFQPLSASVAAEALVRQRIPQDQAISIAAQNGINSDDFLLWSDMLGRPIATGQALQLARRGEFTFTQFKEAVARSDVRTEYADDLWKLRRVIPPLFQIIRLLAGGSITPELATRYVTEQGYDAELAAAIVHAGAAHKTQKTRDLTAIQVDAIYESGIENKDWATQHLIALGYDNDEAQWHLELLDSRRLLAALQAAVNTIHRTYVGHKIDRLTASNELDQLGIRVEVRDDLLETWTHERESNVARLTNAQIGRALKMDLISRDDAIARWQQNGYDAADAEILAGLAKHPGAGTNPTASG